MKTEKSGFSCLVELAEKFKKQSYALMEEYNIQAEKLTRKQIASALSQALECGDFQKHIYIHEHRGLINVLEVGHNQKITYIPARRVQELQARVTELEEELNGYEGIYWCNSHQRQATHKDDKGNMVCDPKLGGKMIPCRTVFAHMRISRQT